MRWLGLDLGSRRLGIAVSDPLGITAQPLQTYKRGASTAEDLRYLAGVARQYAPAAFVLGLPLDGDGSVGRQARKVLRFKEKLEQELGLDVHTWDERLSTVAVERVLLDADLSRRRRRQVVDKLAAAYILQGFLDHLQHQRSVAGEDAP